MPGTSQKKKQSQKRNKVHSSTSRASRSNSLLTKHPKLAIGAGVGMAIIGLYLLVFESHRSAMAGIAMLLLMAGGVMAFIARIATPKKLK